MFEANLGYIGKTALKKSVKTEAYKAFFGPAGHPELDTDLPILVTLCGDSDPHSPQGFARQTATLVLNRSYNNPAGFPCCVLRVCELGGT